MGIAFFILGALCGFFFMATWVASKMENLLSRLTTACALLDKHQRAVYIPANTADFHELVTETNKFLYNKPNTLG